MKIALAIFADFEQAFLGASQLETAIAGRAIIDHTLLRAARTTQADSFALVTQPRDETQARRALERAGLADRFARLPIDNGQRPRRTLIRTARKWALDSWRGGLLGTSWFDEFVEIAEVARVVDTLACDALLCLDGHQPAFDPALADAMIQYQREHANETDFVFCQAPPGLAGLLLGRETLRDLLKLQAPFGVLLSYHPDSPRMDLITKPMCYRVDPDIARCAARLRGDTRCSRELLERAFDQLGADCPAGDLCRWLAGGGYDRASRLPVEVEIELTTDDPLPETRLRPRGARCPVRRLPDVEPVQRVAAELAEVDDRLLWFGGFGDPLADARLPEALDAARAAGVLGIGLATPLVSLSDKQVEAIFSARLDVLSVLLDADTPQTYRNVHGADHFAAVVANIERIAAERERRHSPQPIVVPTMTRCQATRDEIEAFYDRWTRATGSAVIDGYRRFGGLLEGDSLPGTVPPVREACMRINSRLMLLADGRAVLCSEDATGQQIIGEWFRQSLADIWTGSQRQTACEQHARLVFEGLPLCAGCDQWHRG